MGLHPLRHGTALAVLWLAGCAHPPAAPPAGRVLDASAEAAPVAAPCPSGIGAEIRCLAGQDSTGAHYLIALPREAGQWNGRLVVHAHGGPFLGAPTAKRVAEDLQRWSIMPRAGYAWVASSFRQGGVAVTAAAEDTERVRQIFVRHVARPSLTILHGQSWGAGVAAKGAELFTRDATTGKPPYDGVLLTSGVLAGGSRSYDFRTDLRAVYQYLCNNHPRPDEPAYPLNNGLPAGASLPNAEVTRRANECLGLDKPAAERSPAQARKLKTIVDVIRIPERSIAGHLGWATSHFQDITYQRTGGRSPFGNVGVRYTGSDDDAALNAAVPRFAADPAAQARFAADTDPSGQIPVPVLTVHAIHDPIAFVELQSHFGQTMRQAGRGDALVQTYSDDREHSYISDASYVALMEALQAWTEAGRKPTPAEIAAGCTRAQAKFPSSCRMRPDYQPAPLDSRVPPRGR